MAANSWHSELLQALDPPQAARQPRPAERQTASRRTRSSSSSSSSREATSETGEEDNLEDELARLAPKCKDCKQFCATCCFQHLGQDAVWNLT